MKKFKRNNGITLVSLVIIIVILLILATITIGALTGDNGLISKSIAAKEQAEIDNEKGIIDICTVQAMGKSKIGDITKATLQEELNNYAKNNNTEALKNGDDLYVHFIDTDRYYTVDNDGNIEGPVTVNRATDKYPGDITKDAEGRELSGLTETDAYQINCIEDLCALSNSVNNETKRYQNKYIKVMRNLDFKSDFSYINGHIAVEGNIASCDTIEDLMNLLTSGVGFYPIAINSNSITFGGIFDGDNYIISNLYENFEEDTSIVGGLFGACQGATIKNLTVEGEIKAYRAAGISQYIRNTTIANCVNKANIEGEKLGGGIVGNTYVGATISKIVNCANYGNISGGQFNAGIIGWDWAADTLVYNCLNAGKVNNGILTQIYTTYTTKIVNCFNIGICSDTAFGTNTTLINGYCLVGTATSLGNTSAIEYDEEYMKSEEFVNKLNTFITTDASTSEIDTTGWAKWVYNENDFPTLDTKTIWDGTKWQEAK